ncbi:MAG: tetratricopeptide repeat protein [Bacteroidota bacterium]
MRHLILALAMVTLMVAPTPTAQAQSEDSTLVARYQLAESYLRAAQYERAITILEDLYRASPQSNVFFERLKEAYESIKRYDDALALVDQQLARTPNALGLADKARILYLKGDEMGAFDTWQSAIATSPENRNVYRVVFISMRELRLFDKGIEILEQGREALANPALFQNDLAYMYGLTGQFEKALTEYLALISENERQLGFVRARLSPLLDNPGALETGIALAERRIREAPMNHAYRELLGWMYMEAQRYPDAFNTYLALDRLQQAEGRILLNFAKGVAAADAFDTALEAYTEILTRYPTAALAPEVRFGIAQMHERRAEAASEQAYDAMANRIPAPNYEQALETYRDFLQRHPNHPFYPDALRRIGQLQQNIFRDLGAAEATLNEVIARYPSSTAAEQAAFELGEIALIRGDLEQARIRFGRVEDELRIGELAEQARLELAYLHYFKGEFDAASTIASAIDENTSTDIANDAITLKLLLSENRGPDSLSTLLQAYAAVELLERQQRPDDALTAAEALMPRAGGHPIDDDLRFLRATLLRDQGDAEAAHQAFGEIVLMYPQSYLADRSLFARANLLADALGRPDDAIAVLTTLLNTYPGSLLIPDVRAKLRVLRGDGA